LVFLGASAIRSTVRPPPYPLISDGLVPLTFTSLLFFVRAAEARNIMILIAVMLATGLAGISSLWLGVRDITKGNVGCELKTDE
jgi:hypothetical protein